MSLPIHIEKKSIAQDFSVAHAKTPVCIGVTKDKAVFVNVTAGQDREDVRKTAASAFNHGAKMAHAFSIPTAKLDSMAPISAEMVKELDIAKAKYTKLTMGAQAN